MKKTTPQTPSTQSNGPLVIESLDQLQAMVDAPLYADFTLDGRPIRIACKRLTPVLDEQVRAIRREAQPVYVPAQKDYDYTDKAYLAKRDANEKIARNLIVYCGCPAIAAKRPGLTDKKQIHDFVRDLLSEPILEIVALTIQAGGMGLADRVNFTSPAASEN